MAWSLAPHPPLSRYYSGSASKPAFVRRVFDEAAEGYDKTERLMAMGSGDAYRRRALARNGLHSGMHLLDVAIGTGLVARQAMALVGTTGRVMGIDPSVGMLRQARMTLGIPLLMGRAEELPLADEQFDFLSMGYALRHVSDLPLIFTQFLRVLRSGGIVCVLEITRPENRLAQAAMSLYLRRLVPWLTRFKQGSHQDRSAKLLWEYYWDTIRACVEPEHVLDAMRRAGFINVERFSQWGIFSEYRGVKPA